MKIVVLHEFYGCETGCCGHVIEVDGERRGWFNFDHPRGCDFREYAEFLVESEMGKLHVNDLDWENCLIIDCD